MYNACLFNNTEIINKMININEVMLKFIKDFQETSSPRFWSRWDEQLRLLIEIHENVTKPYTTQLYTYIHDVYYAKFLSQEELKILLIATDTLDLAECATKLEKKEWRKGRSSTNIIYEDHLLDRDLASFIMKVRDELNVQQSYKILSS